MEKYYEFTSASELDDFYAYYASVDTDAGLVVFDPPEGSIGTIYQSYDNVTMCNFNAVLYAAIINTSYDGAAPVTHIKYTIDFNETHNIVYDFTIYIWSDGTGTVEYSDADGINLVVTFGWPGDGWIVVSFLPDNYIEVADANGYTLATAYDDPAYVEKQHSVVGFEFDVQEYGGLTDVMVDMIYIAYTPPSAASEGNASVLLRPGDAVSVIARADRDAWRPGAEYIITIYFRDTDTRNIFTETVKFRA